MPSHVRTLERFHKVVKIEPVLRQCHNIRRLILFLRLECSDDAGNNENPGDKKNHSDTYLKMIQIMAPAEY